jgi:hypothetical protein
MDGDTFPEVDSSIVNNFGMAQARTLAAADGALYVTGRDGRKMVIGAVRTSDGEGKWGKSSS